MKNAKGYLLRKGRFSEANRCYLVTTITFNRLPLFNDFHKARSVINAMRFLDSQGYTKTWSYILMPDHLHWLVQLTSDKTLSAVVHSLKSYTAKILGAKKTWQSGCHDHALRDGEDIREYARYIIMNPVRAGLVARPSDYSHWDAAWL
jgi:putative transposase